MNDDNGIVHLRSRYAMLETSARLEQAIRERGLRLFARIDHAAAAAEVGLTMPPAVVYVFGNPSAGTALMLAAPSLALDLPFKVLIREDAAGQAWLSYNAPAWLAQRHGLAGPLADGLNGLANLVRTVAGSAPG